MIYRVHYVVKLRAPAHARKYRVFGTSKKAVHMDDGGGGKLALYRLCANVLPAAEGTLLTDDGSEVTCKRCQGALYKRGVAALKQPDGPNFSAIIQDPAIKNIVQKGILERAFHDTLFPKLLYKEEQEK